MINATAVDDDLWRRFIVLTAVYLRTAVYDGYAMPKWLFAAVLVVGAHFGASYLVPLNRNAQETFGGLLKWFWPWADGDRGPLGVMTVSSGFPVAGFFVAVTSATLFLLAALAVMNIWVSLRWWRWFAFAGAVLSLFLMLMFFGATKVAPIAPDILVLWTVWTKVAVRV